MRDLEYSGHSLNVLVNGTPHFIIAAKIYGLDKKIKKDMKKQYPNRCHIIGMEGHHTYLLTVMQYNAVEQKLNEKVDLSTSNLVIGD